MAVSGGVLESSDGKLLGSSYIDVAVGSGRLVNGSWAISDRSNKGKSIVGS